MHLIENNGIRSYQRRLSEGGGSCKFFSKGHNWILLWGAAQYVSQLLASNRTPSSRRINEQIIRSFSHPENEANP